jgi:hypothetical protein
MTRPTAATRRLALVATAAAIAIPASLAHAHDVTEPTINGPSNLGTTLAGSGKFDLPGVTLDCPPPDSAPPCRVTVKVKSRTALQLRAGGSRKVRTIGRVTYELEANRDLAEIWPAVLTSDGVKALKRYGKVKAVARVVNTQGEHSARRDLKLTVKPE